MSPEIIGLFMVGGMIAGVFVGFPISFTLIFLGLVFGYWGFGKLVFFQLTLQFYGTMMESTLTAVPLFVLMGILMERANLMERLFDAVQGLLWRVRGALYLTVMFVATVFAAATGIVGASVTLLGIMAGKPMIRAGYDARLSSGLIAAGGTLGILIPPSVVLVIYAILTEQSIGKLFLAAMVPGILAAVGYMIAISIYVRMNRWAKSGVLDKIPQLLGKPLKLNVSGAIPAVLLGAGFPVQALKGVPILARTAGLIAHLFEEMQQPIGFALSYQATREMVYDGDVPAGFGASP